MKKMPRAVFLDRVNLSFSRYSQSWALPHFFSVATATTKQRVGALNEKREKTRPRCQNRVASTWRQDKFSHFSAEETKQTTMTTCCLSLYDIFTPKGLPISYYACSGDFFCFVAKLRTTLLLPIAFDSG